MAWKPKRIEKKWEEFKSTWRIWYYIQNSRREFEVSTSRKEDKKKKPMKIGFYCSSQKKKRKERKKPKKTGFYYINLYFRGIVSLRKRINNFTWLQQLHKSQMPLLALSRGKTTNKEREKVKKNIIRDFVSQKKESGFLLKEKEKGDIFRDIVSKKKRYTCAPLFCWREEVETSFPVLWVYQ